MAECGLTDALRHRAELGTDVDMVAKFVNFHQKLLHDIEVRHIFICFL